MPALLFGSISTVADTSEIQREAFNAAFREHGLDWHWDRDAYRELLASSGGEQRIADQARASGETVDAAAVHATKTARFQQLLAEAQLRPRAGVTETIRDAKASGFGVAFVTTTSAANVAAVLAAVQDDLPASWFDVVLDLSHVEHPKPDGDAYRHALRALGEPVEQCLAIEDNVGGVAAAADAGVRCAAFPNANTAGHDFTAATAVVDHLAFDDLRALLPA
ncbi:HAD-IA family hydrolase [Paraconexibacter algicola]|uniref:Haloacid dehalogenase n=1 Tax=Paraconexibacter algicola TaxID=2133960 RepID=A0A2T4UCQ0_9ACTN|nr:HAD-IA family hydrolase [Paraconexibacter algicola]PTL54989.1 haloacid dehalogenase [Paraconexibacter algicola]